MLDEVFICIICLTCTSNYYRFHRSKALTSKQLTAAGKILCINAAFHVFYCTLKIEQFSGKKIVFSIYINFCVKYDRSTFFEPYKKRKVNCKHCTSKTDVKYFKFFSNYL